MNIIMQHSHVNYPDNYEIVRDGRTLNALLKIGFIDGWDKNYKYVEDGERFGTSYKYKGILYTKKYFDGCFMPFVCKIIDINLNNEGGVDVK